MTNEQLKELLDSLTIEEKIGQMFQGNGQMVGVDGAVTGVFNTEEYIREDVLNMGSVLNIMGKERLKKIQKGHLEHNKIPLMFMADIIYGYNEIYPLSLGMASSFDMDLIEKSARISASEATQDGLNVTFSPMVDISRDARWGRCAEGYGEDTLLSCRCAKAMVKGYQGNSISDDDSLIACVKHFAAYGATYDGKDYNSVEMSERKLRETYLPPYKAAVDAGARMIMSSFNTINGVPMTLNKKYLKNLLRDEWGYEHVIITDYGAVWGLTREGGAENHEQACKMTVEAGVDIDMMDNVFLRHIKNLVEKGELSMELVDECVMRILRCKNELGLLDDPYKYLDETKPDTNDYEANYEFAKQTVYESSVLLKNDGILPLDKSEKVALIGPFVHDDDLVSEWSFVNANRRRSVTINNAIKAKSTAFEGVEIGSPYILDGEIQNTIYDKCSEAFGREEEYLSRAVELAKKADTVVLTIGESKGHYGENHSRADISVPKAQMNLFNAIYQVNKNIVVVLFQGRPLTIPEISEKARAVLNVWYPGTAGGEAIADMIYGDALPSGKLSMSMPRAAGQCPVFYSFLPTNHYNAEDVFENYESRYLDIKNAPLYPFGFGLTYTTFEYSDFALSNNEMDKKGSITASVNVKNTGDKDGFEVVQLYIRDRFATGVSRPIKELKDFKRIFIKSGETVKVEFEINEEMLRFYTINEEFASEPGEFHVIIGSSSADESQGIKVFNLK